MHLGASFHLLRAELHSSAALLSHWAVTGSAGVRAPLSTRWEADGWQAGAGYFNRIDDHTGYEIFGGYGQQHFKSLLDTVSCSEPSGFYTGRSVDNIINTNIFYHHYFFNPDIWIKTHAFKFILGVSFKYLATPHFNYHVTQYVVSEDSTVHVNFEKNYDQSAHMLLLEPSFQVRAGRKLSGYVEVKTTTVLNENLNHNIEFNTPRMLISVGLEYYFHLK